MDSHESEPMDNSLATIAPPLSEIAAMIVAEAAQDANAYLQETVVPHGGE